MKKIILLIFLFFSLSAITYSQHTGQLDSTFANNGMVKIDTNSFSCTAIQSDGKIVVAGLAFDRYNADGSIDNTFKNHKVDFNITSIAIQSDGRIVVAGSAIARYNTDGSLDNTFSGDGKQTSDFNITSMAIQPNGKIVVGGAAVARYNKDGSLDNTFNGNGIKSTGVAVASIAVQKDNKIVVAGTIFNALSLNDFAVVRCNSDGSLDTSFSNDGIQTTNFYYEHEFFTDNADDKVSSVTIQNDGKIVVAGGSWGGTERQYNPEFSFSLVRYNTDGSLDVKQRANFGDFFGPTTTAKSVVIENNGKIIIAGYVAERFAFARFKADGSVDETFGNKGVLKTSVSEDASDVSILNSVAYDSLDDKLYVVGYIGKILSNPPYEDLVPTYGLFARYLLNNENSNQTLNVSLSIPGNIIKYASPARIKLNDLATDKNSTVTKVRFYNGTTLLHTETEFPYGFLWEDVPVGNYILTAKAYNKSGNVATSNNITVSVVDQNVPPVVSIVNPVTDTTYAGPATIHLEANAKDANDRISKVEFYNGKTLLRAEYIYPYTYSWTNIEPGAYTITAIATDDKGLSATSAPVTITVANATIVNSRPLENTNINYPVSLKLTPNPTSNSLQIFTNGLRQNTSTTISIISIAGVAEKTIHTNASNNILLDVSSLHSGVYTIKIINGDKTVYKQFIKL
ncbi:Ig-like domain-containing protein [Segetibacter koreensis]|uniref:Ig-like domain-containing protein n=1 Tax=Segetibacter koreensis TaxID=398037 RepID=UPI00035E3686|nr:Ig-like domain-containing protein [Segetibacter koreensis]